MQTSLPRWKSCCVNRCFFATCLPPHVMNPIALSCAPGVKSGRVTRSAATNSDVTGWRRNKTLTEKLLGGVHYAGPRRNSASCIVELGAFIGHRRARGNENPFHARLASRLLPRSILYRAL